MRTITRLAALADAPLAALAVSAAPAGAAVAATPRSTTPVSTIYSQFLGGDVAAGTFRLGDVRVVVTNLPDLSAYNAAGGPADTVLEGDTLAHDTSGGLQYGMSLVWNDPSSTCDATQWVVETGTGTTTSAEPLPAADLTPVQEFGSDICLDPGQSQAIETYDSTGHHEIVFQAGFTISTEIAVQRDYGVYSSFFAAGRGVDVTSGADAGLLPSGSVANFGSSGLTELSDNSNGAHQTRITFAKTNIFAVEGTVTGAHPSPTNPATLVPSFTGGPASAGRVVVP